MITNNYHCLFHNQRTLLLTLLFTIIILTNCQSWSILKTDQLPISDFVWVVGIKTATETSITLCFSGNQNNMEMTEMVSAEKYCTGIWDVWPLSGNPREVFSLRRTCQLKMFGLNGAAWDFKISSASVWTHKTLLELELFVHSWGPAWTHKAHYKTSLVWAVCPLLQKYCYHRQVI